MSAFSPLVADRISTSNPRRTWRSGWFGALALSVLISGSVEAGASIRGHVYDASRSTARLREQGIDSDAYKTPLADAAVEIFIPAVRAAAFPVTTDAEGAFELDTGVDTLPQDALVVAKHRSDGAELFSASRAASDRLELFLYAPSADTQEVQALLTVAHDFQKVGDRKLLRTRARVQLWNRGDRLFVGGSSRYGEREVFRLPIPAGAEIVRKSGPEPGMRWRSSEDGRHLIIDEPVPGFPDLLASFDKLGGPGSWEVEYLVDPPALFTPTYEFGVRPASRQAGDRFDGFLLYVPHEQVKIESKSLQQFNIAPDQQKDPFTGEAKKYDVYGPARPVEAGQSLLVPMEISSGAIGRVSPKALFWHGGTLLVGLVAVLFGFLLSSRRPPAEAVLEGLSSAQVLDRIAELDARFEQKKISEAEYQRYRAPLVEIAAEELRAQDATAGGPEIVVTASPRSPEVQRLLDAIAENETRGEDPDSIRERAHLLEALHKAVQNAVTPGATS